MTSQNIYDHKILILDFGSQYTQLIARRVREEQVYCEIHPYNMEVNAVRAFSPKGIILSGGPADIFEEDAPSLDRHLLELDVPVLGICYGMQALAHVLDGIVESASDREYGSALIKIEDDQDLFFGLKDQDEEAVWMSHGNRVKKMPAGFLTLAGSENSPIAAMVDSSRRLFGVQFHPESLATREGKKIIRNFLKY